MLLAFLSSTLTALTVGAHQISPIRRAFRRARKRWNEALEPLREVFRFRDRQRSELESKARTYEDQWRERVRKQTEIEELKHFGAAARVPWAALREGGFDSVEKLRAAGREEWARIHGVGAQTVETLVSSLKTFETDLRERRAPLPTPDQLDPAGTELLEEAASLLALNQLIAPQEAAAKKAADRVEYELARLREESSFLSWINPFGRKDRARVHQAESASFAEAAPELESTLREVEGLRDEIRAMPRPVVPRPGLQEDYRRRNADYLSLLEPYFGAGSDALRGQGLFSKDLLQRIEAESLQLEGLNVTLRGYQDFGAKFMVVQGRILIGDEMGLGKTIQALAAVTHLRNAAEATHFLVVCPPSIVDNWAREIERRSDFQPFVLRGFPDQHAFLE